MRENRFLVHNLHAIKNSTVSHIYKLLSKNYEKLMIDIPLRHMVKIGTELPTKRIEPIKNGPLVDCTIGIQRRLCNLR